MTGSAVREVLETMAFAYVTSVDDEIPSDRVDFPLFGLYNDASDQRLWAAGDYTLTMVVELDSPHSGGNYTVEMWIPTPGSLAIAAIGALAMGRRRRSVT